MCIYASIMRFATRSNYARRYSLKLSIKNIITYCILFLLLIFMYIYGLNGEDIYIYFTIILTILCALINIPKREYIVFTFLMFFVISLAVGQNYLFYYALFTSIVFTLVFHKLVFILNKMTLSHEC